MPSLVYNSGGKGLLALCPKGDTDKPVVSIFNEIKSKLTSIKSKLQGIVNDGTGLQGHVNRAYRQLVGPSFEWGGFCPMEEAIETLNVAEDNGVLWQDFSREINALNEDEDYLKSVAEAQANGATHILPPSGGLAGITVMLRPDEDDTFYKVCPKAISQKVNVRRLPPGIDDLCVIDVVRILNGFAKSMLVGRAQSERVTKAQKERLSAELERGIKYLDYLLPSSPAAQAVKKDAIPAFKKLIDDIDKLGYKWGSDSIRSEWVKDAADIDAVYAEYAEPVLDKNGIVSVKQKRGKPKLAAAVSVDDI